MSEGTQLLLLQQQVKRFKRELRSMNDYGGRMEEIIVERDDTIGSKNVVIRDLMKEKEHYAKVATARRTMIGEKEEAINAIIKERNDYVEKVRRLTEELELKNRLLASIKEMIQASGE